MRTGTPAARKQHVEAADAWTKATADRLSISREAVLRAIERRWTAEAIDRVEQAAELLGRPPTG